MVTDQCHMTENPQEGTSIQSKKKLFNSKSVWES